MDTESLNLTVGQVIKLYNDDGLYEILTIDFGVKIVMLAKYNPDKLASEPKAVMWQPSDFYTIEKVVRYAGQHRIENNIEEMVVM